MLRLFLILFLFFQDATPSITSPQAGETLRGQIQIQGGMNLPNFASAELAFQYASDSADSWFPIQTFSQPPADSTIAIWDTTSITDGDYNLRLRVNLQDGTFQDVLVTDLKVRNDEALPTATPKATESTFNFSQLNETPGALPANEPTQISAASYPTSTPLPQNPASITTSSILSMFGRSALVALVLFLFFSLLLRLRRNA